jgi:hypothetical protein
VVNTQAGDLNRLSMAAYIPCLGRKSVWRDYSEPRHVRSMGPYTGAGERGEREKGEGRSRWKKEEKEKRGKGGRGGTTLTGVVVVQFVVGSRHAALAAPEVAWRASESCTLTMRMKHGFSASEKGTGIYCCVNLLQSEPNIIVVC